MRTPQQAAQRALSRPWGGAGILWGMDMLRPGESNTGFLRKWSSSGDWKGKVVLEVGDDRLNVQLTSRREPLLMLAPALGSGPLLIEPSEDAIVLNFALLGFDDFYVEGVPRCAPHESDVGYLMAADAGQMLGRGGMHINDAQLRFTIAGYRRHIVGHGAADGEVIALRFEVSE
jgi:hypothetical protein